MAQPQVEANLDVGQIAPAIQPAAPRPRKMWLTGWNGYLKKKNWICLYFSFIEIVSLLIFMLVWTSDSNYIALLAIPFMMFVLDFFHIGMVAWTQKHQEQSTQKVNTVWPLWINVFKLAL
jgi:hypothetical protein